MSFMLSTEAVVDWALAAVPSFLFRSSASPAPYTMYTAPVPPVTMLSVFPVKFGVPLACAVAAGEPARGALQATATSTTATNEATIRAAFLISHLPRNGRSLRRLRCPRAVEPERAPGFGRGLDALHDLAAVDVAVGVRVRGQHRPRHHGLRSRDGLRRVRRHRAILSSAP